MGFSSSHPFTFSVEHVLGHGIPWSWIRSPHVLSCLLSDEDESGSGPVIGVTGLGYSGGAGGAQWDRGANLKEYYARRDEQEAQAVRPEV